MTDDRDVRFPSLARPDAALRFPVLAAPAVSALVESGEDWPQHWYETQRLDLSLSDARLCGECGATVQYLRQHGHRAVVIETEWPPYRQHQCDPMAVAAIRAHGDLQAAASALLTFTDGMIQQQGSRLTGAQQRTPAPDGPPVVLPPPSTLAPTQPVRVRTVETL